MARTARHGAAPRVKKLGAVLAAMCLTSLTLSACTEEEPKEPRNQALDHFGYIANSTLKTTNAGSTLGASTSAEVLASRVYPAAYVQGPSGQMIPNTDLLSTQALPSTNPQVVYTIAEDAKFSDGVPITCDDFLLSFSAAKMPELFDSHMPVVEDAISLDCAPGAKKFTVVFNEGHGDQWRMLFGPGTVLPSHVIAERAGLDDVALVQALDNFDAEALGEVARIWREDFNLDHFDPELQVSAGPYKVESVGQKGEVTLVRNENYYGDAPELDTIVVWPQGSDATHLAEEEAIAVADVPAGGDNFVHRNEPTNPFDISAVVGRMNDTLVLSKNPEGIFATPEARHAFAACVNQTELAKVSSGRAGQEVPAIAAHVLSDGDPEWHQLQDLADQHQRHDVDTAAAELLRGATIRVAYEAPNDRLTAMVNALATDCATAGIEVVDVSDQVTNPLGQMRGPEASVDAVLMAVEPQREYGDTGMIKGDIEKMRAREQQLWDEAYYLPIAAQPRTFVIDRNVGNVVVYTGPAGIGWNMDRWKENTPSA